jgi:hypothetical protein
MIEAFVVHAREAQHHAHVAALGQEHRLAPEAVQVDMVAESGGFPPWLDDLIESEHQATSTRGTLCSYALKNPES